MGGRTDFDELNGEQNSLSEPLGYSLNKGVKPQAFLCQGNIGQKLSRLGLKNPKLEVAPTTPLILEPMKNL